MRIISGSFKGKKILEPKDIKTRPLKDLTKESIFNIINHSNKFKINIENSIILDLFSGVGSFGIECLSRKAKKVIFVEHYKGVLPILKNNLLSLKSIVNYDIIEENIHNNLFLKLKYKFDIIFLDPPYKKGCFETIEILKKNNITNENHIIIIHREINSGDEIEKQLNILDNRIYGRSEIFFAKFF